jgi:S-adenosylmethionine-diacylgycerolhomoserine-N-methlytransferase
VARFGLDALDGFYRFHAPVYDWTRPLLLLGRREVVHRLGIAPGDRVLDVGCGTGFSLPRLHARGARVVGIEPSPAMRRRAAHKLERLGLSGVVDLDPRPYGSHTEYEGAADRILLSYSLSMIPPFEAVIERVLLDLSAGGRVAVVDFLDAWGPVGLGLRHSHVHLGDARLRTLRRRLPHHSLEVRHAGLWSYYIFVAERGASTASSASARPGTAAGTA